LTLEEFRKVLPKQLLYWLFSQRSKDFLAKSNLPYRKKNALTKWEIISL